MSSKRVKMIRRYAILVLLVVVVLALIISTAVFEQGQKKYMTAPELSKGEIYRVSDIDAADPAGFTDLSPVTEEGYAKVAENDAAILYLKEDGAGIKVYQKATGEIWSSLPSQEMVDSIASESYKNMMKGMLSFSYVELTNTATTMQVLQAYSSTAAHTVTSETIWGGVRVTYAFTELNISVALEILLDGDALVVRVPDDKMVENEDGPALLAEAQAEMDGNIEEIRATFEEVKSVAKRDLSESSAKAVEENANKALKKLINITNSAGTGEVSFKDVDLLNDYIKSIQKRMKKYADISEKLSNTEEVITNLTEYATLLAKGKATGIVQLHIMPYFGAQKQGTDGYIFYPDGSGAISYFNWNHPTMAGQYSADVYSKHGDLIAEDAEFTGASSVNMPVYGVKVGDSAFIAIMTDSDTNASITFNSCKSDAPIANVYGSYYLRNSTTMVNSAGGHTLVYDTNRIRDNRETRYAFLSGDQADYAGMAVTYRDYLEDSGKLARSKLMDREDIPLSTWFFMGTYSGTQDSLFQSYLPATTFSDIHDFLKRMEEKGIDDVFVSVTNWSDGTYMKRPQATIPVAEIGGTAGLQELGKWMSERNLPLSVDYYPIWVKQSQVTYGQFTVGSVKAKSQMIRTAGVNGQIGAAMNPVYVYNNMKMNILPALKKNGVSAVTLDGLDSLIFDYNEYAPVNRQDTAKIFSMVYQMAAEGLGYASSLNDEPPQYLYNVVDWAYMSNEDSGYLYSDETVPFSQIVLHGSIFYLGDDFNYFHDAKKQTLQMIEYGYLPSYSLTTGDVIELRNNGVEGLYSTDLASWEDRIVETYQEFNDAFRDTWNVKISDHEKRSSTVSILTYENGVKIYINYAGQEQTVDGVTVGAESYLVVR